MTVLRAGGVAGKLSADLAIAGTTITSAGLADLPAVASPDIAKITLFQTDANGRVTKREVVYVTAHTASATTATIQKAKEGTTDQAWNGSSTPDSWAHAPTASEFGLIGYVVYTGGGVVTTTGTTGADVDATNLKVTFTAPSTGAVRVTLSCNAWCSAVVDQRWGLRDAGGNLTATGARFVTAVANTSGGRAQIQLYITGLTPGTSYTWKWAWLVTAGTGNIQLDANGQPVMEVFALP